MFLRGVCVCVFEFVRMYICSGTVCTVYFCVCVLCVRVVYKWHKQSKVLAILHEFVIHWCIVFISNACFSSSLDVVFRFHTVSVCLYLQTSTNKTGGATPLSMKEVTPSLHPSPFFKLTLSLSDSISPCFRVSIPAK